MSARRCGRRQTDAPVWQRAAGGRWRQAVGRAPMRAGGRAKMPRGRTAAPPRDDSQRQTAPGKPPPSIAHMRERGQAAKHRRRRKAASSSEASHQPHRPASGAQSFQTRPPSKTRTLDQHTPPPIPSPSSALRFCWRNLGELRVRERKN